MQQMGNVFLLVIADAEILFLHSPTINMEVPDV